MTTLLKHDNYRANCQQVIAIHDPEAPASATNTPQLQDNYNTTTPHTYTHIHIHTHAATLTIPTLTHNTHNTAQSYLSLWHV